VGRVVKGSQSSGKRYTLAVPVLAPQSAEEPPAESFGADDYGFPAAPEPVASFIPAPPPEPAVDVEALRAQAQALIDEATANAEALLTDAHERARTMIADSAARADAIAESARAAAQSEGFTAGQQAADREMSEMLATMRNLVDMARVERHNVIAAAEPEIVKLAMGIAERVLHQQIALDRGVVVEMAKAAIARLVDRESITVRVNPSDLERMREHREEMLAVGDVKNVRIIEDQRVDRGGVVVETDAGSIDAKISTQIAEAKRVLHIEDDIVLTPAEPAERPLTPARAS
jgi:flagellar assembly protein FliH